MMRKIFAFGDSFPAGDELSTPGMLGITLEEWYQYFIDNYTDGMTDMQLVGKYCDEHHIKMQYGLTKSKTSNLAYPSVIGKNLNIETVNYSRSGTGYHIACEWAIQKIITGEIRENDIILMGVSDIYRMSFYTEKTMRMYNYLPGYFSGVEKFNTPNTQDIYRFLKEWVISWVNDYNVHNQTLLNTCGLIHAARNHKVKLLLYDIFSKSGLSSIKNTNKSMQNHYNLSVGVEQRMRAWEKILLDIKSHTFMPYSMFHISLNYGSENKDPVWLSIKDPVSLVRHLRNKKITINGCLESGCMPWFHYTKEKHQYIGNILTKYINNVIHE